MVASSTRTDYYAVLQVHPDADREVIDAAYRQLMKKYHPDKAGGDPARAAIHHQRAKAINEAYRVLRDPVQRQMYDRDPDFVVSRRADPHPPGPAPAQPPSASPPQTAPGAAPTPPSDDVDWSERRAAESLVSATLRAPLDGLAAAYYLLPGRYEWEKGGDQEILSVCLLPPLGVAAFCLATARLAPWLGHSSNATLLAWAILGLLSLPLWRSVPRIAMAAVPSILLTTGIVNPLLDQARIPALLAWALLGIVSLILSARLYVFGVLPTLAVCWVITRFA